MSEHSSMSERTSESGSVMILAMLVTMLILGIGITAMWISSSNMKVSGNLTRRQENVYTAEAGLEHARIVLLTSTFSWSELLTSINCNATKDDIGGKGKVLCAGALPATPLEDIPIIQGSKVQGAGRANMAYTIWIRNDDVEAAANIVAGIPEQQDNDGRLVARVGATGKDQLSYFALEVVLTAPVASGGVKEGYVGQLGGGAQGAHSGKGSIALP